MAKQAGLGDNFYFNEFDLSGDISALDHMSGGPALGDLTGINKSAHERIGLIRSGNWQFTSWFNNAAGQSHKVLSVWPTADVVGTYFRGTTIGNPSAGITGKQLDYVPARDNQGNLTLKAQVEGNGFGMSWGKMLTPGLRTDSAATVGAFFDDGAGTNFGGIAFIQLVAFTGTSVTIDIQSATTSGGTYTTTGLTTAALTAAGQGVRLAVANNVTINEFLKVNTTGTFSNAQYSVTFCRWPIAVVF